MQWTTHELDPETRRLVRAVAEDERKLTANSVVGWCLLLAFACLLIFVGMD